MLSLPLVALCLATIGGYAKSAVRAASGLEVSLSTPTDKVASVSDLRVVATVKNASDKDLKILKFGTVLDAQHHARPFVVSKDGKEVPFTGTEVLAHMDYTSEDNWVVIHAGKDAITEYDAVSTLYDFSASGPGTFTFDPISKFRVAGPNDTYRIEIANARSISVTIADASKRELKLEKRTKLIDCGDNRNDIITSSVQEATVIANTAISYIKSNRGTDDLYKFYFGSHPTDSVIFNLTKIANSITGDMVLSCSDHCADYEFAYSNGLDIYFCKPFYDQQPLSTLCKNDPPRDHMLRGIRSETAFYYIAKAFLPDENANIPEAYLSFADRVMVRTGC